MATTGAILGLAGDEKNLGRMVMEIEKMVAASFVTHPMRSMTHREVKRRFGMCVEIFEHLRGSLKWGLEKSVDKMPEYFGAALDGADWKPDPRTIWTANEST